MVPWHLGGYGTKNKNKTKNIQEYIYNFWALYSLWFWGGIWEKETKGFTETMVKVNKAITKM